MNIGRATITSLLYATSVVGIFISLALGLFCLLAKAHGDSQGAVGLGLLGVVLFALSIVCFGAAGHQARRIRRDCIKRAL